MDVSIILVNYNTRKLTMECLKSIYEKTSGVNFEVIVIDNASEDDSIQAIKKNFSQVQVIESPINLGFGRANNLGIKASKAKYVFFLNTDTVLINNAVKILFDFMENDKEAGACGGNLFDEKMKPVHSFGFLKTPQSHFLRLSGLRYFCEDSSNDSNRDKVQQVEQIIGADLMIRKSVLNETGVFDERFFLYFEESELQFRIQKAGYKIFYTPEAQIFHFEGGSSPKNKKFRRQVIAQSEYLYFSLCCKQTPQLILNLLCTIPLLYRLFYAPTYTINVLKYIWGSGHKTVTAKKPPAEYSI